MFELIQALKFKVNIPDENLILLVEVTKIMFIILVSNNCSLKTQMTIINYDPT